MQQIKAIVKGPYEPEDNQVLWIDTSNPDEITEKVFEGGEWKGVSSTPEVRLLCNWESLDTTPKLITEVMDEYSVNEINKLFNREAAVPVIKARNGVFIRDTGIGVEMAANSIVSDLPDAESLANFIVYTNGEYYIDESTDELKAAFTVLVFYQLEQSMKDIWCVTFDCN